MQPAKNKQGRICVKYDTFEEVIEIAVNPPRFCDKCGNELIFWSFYDSLNRFTLKAGCVACNETRAISVNEEKYEERRLKKWADMVKKRAGYKCEMASSKCGGKLHAHHIVPKHADPNKAYDVENGMCLCESHHKMIHRYM